MVKENINVFMTQMPTVRKQITENTEIVMPEISNEWVSPEIHEKIKKSVGSLKNIEPIEDGIFTLLGL